MALPKKRKKERKAYREKADMHAVFKFLFVEIKIIFVKSVNFLSKTFNC